MAKKSAAKEQVDLNEQDEQDSQEQAPAIGSTGPARVKWTAERDQLLVATAIEQGPDAGAIVELLRQSGAFEGQPLTEKEIIRRVNACRLALKRAKIDDAADLASRLPEFPQEQTYKLSASALASFIRATE